MGCCQAPASCKPNAYTPSANAAKSASADVETAEIDITNDDAILGESYEEIKLAPSPATGRVEEPHKALVGNSAGNKRVEELSKASQPRSTGANSLDVLDTASPQKVQQHRAATDITRIAVALPAPEAEKRGGQALTQDSGRYKSVEEDGNEPPLLEALGEKKSSSWKYGALAGSLVMRGDNAFQKTSDDSDSDGSDWMEAKRRSLAKAAAEQKELEMFSCDVEDTRVELADLDKDLMFEDTLKRPHDI